MLKHKKKRPYVFQITPAERTAARKKNVEERWKKTPAAERSAHAREMARARWNPSRNEQAA